jgi:hypothetical protein
MGAWVNYGLGSEAENLPGFVVMVSTGRVVRRSRSRRASGAAVFADAFSGRAAAGSRRRRALSHESRPRLARAAGRRHRGDQLPQPPAQRLRARSRDRHAHRAVRVGVSVCRPACRSCGPSRRECRRRSRATAARRATARLRATVCSRVASRSAECVSSSSTIATGITTACCARSCRCARRRPTVPALRSSPISSSAACSTTRSWCGPASLAARRCRRATRHRRPRSPQQGHVDVARRRRVQRGLVYGATDDLGYAAVDKVCTVHDLHATMLHLLGIRTMRSR